MILHKVLVFYKKSAYNLYFQGKKNPSNIAKNSILKKEFIQLKQAHEEHYATLKIILNCLKKNKVQYVKQCRGENINYKNYDFIITVGGDGTFLEAARNITKQVIMGVNSSPEYSVGRYCIATPNNFEKILKAILAKKIKLTSLPRLTFSINGRLQPAQALNDILLCHKNPAMLCRYYLKIGNVEEKQYNSGIWISTCAGSSAAIKSAGGKLIRKGDQSIQYQPRELYNGLIKKYHLTGGVIGSTEKIIVTSLMHQGMIYVDGAHLSFPFEYGSRAVISRSPHPIKTLKILL